MQSSTAAGKSTLADAVAAFVPEEDLVSLSALTAQALYYLGAGDLARKVLFVSEEHGASRAAYALKLLISEGRLSIASAGKDPGTGRLRTRSYGVEGPVSLLMTTTAPEVDAELANRLVVLGVDEDRRRPRPCRPPSAAPPPLRALWPASVGNRSSGCTATPSACWRLSPSLSRAPRSWPSPTRPPATAVTTKSYCRLSPRLPCCTSTNAPRARWT